jgi:hypothetical protein
MAFVVKTLHEGFDIGFWDFRLVDKIGDKDNVLKSRPEAGLAHTLCIGHSIFK